MSFAQVTNGAMTYPFKVPAIIHTDGGDIDIRPMDPAILATFGIFQVTRTPRPEDTKTVSYTSSLVDLVDGRPVQVWASMIRTPRPEDTAEESHDRTVVTVGNVSTVVWTVRPKTDAELTADAEQAERNRANKRIIAAVKELQRIQQVSEMSNAEQTDAIRQLAAAAVHLAQELIPNLSDMNGTP
jgi:exosome complex RNA-binding protein Rrp42 (RNase PH superfamily)